MGMGQRGSGGVIACASEAEMLAPACLLVDVRILDRATSRVDCTWNERAVGVGACQAAPPAGEANLSGTEKAQG
ncbi:hypothetical protein GGTG_06327 [Gaeumannomyces tritici R3-111a-1]|uniref:Uncharacterized protein n=1 Tax=Gaeumannomyces tritici (strain R3-111a-1) TaxID=644352 RepID=J3NYH5_GAET3|nr:hypothetical protein GGTG_06327 [Gaeumannomyces tritici R3-111a-1]EJT76408.1 hypothetical protein GGTG_06327 [Gaeumannomyces tritici R3-111a-1]